MQCKVTCVVHQSELQCIPANCTSELYTFYEQQCSALKSELQFRRRQCIFGEIGGGCEYLYLFVFVFAFVGVLQCILVQSISLQCICGETGGGGKSLGRKIITTTSGQTAHCTALLYLYLLSRGR